MVRIRVEKRILQWALNRANLTAVDLKHRFPKIEQWLEGEVNPTLRQLEELSKITMTPLGFFFLKDPPTEELPIPLFRTINQGRQIKPSPNLLEVIQIMQLRQDWMREYLVDLGYEPLHFVNSVTINDSPIVVAERMRRILGLDKDWSAKYPTWEKALLRFREAIEDIGIIVVISGIVGNNTHRKLDPSEFRGFILVDDYVPLAFVNGADGKAAQMFTLAHELAHVFFGSSAAFDLREMLPSSDPIEKACDRVAAEFLVPAEKLEEIWSEIRDRAEPFGMVARKFKVSEIVAARRALDLGFINKDRFIAFYNAYKNRERDVRVKGGGGDFYATQNLRISKRFASTVIKAIKEEKLLYSEAYRLTGLYGRTFDRFVNSLKLEGV